MKSKTQIINETAAFYKLGNRGRDGLGCSYLTSDGKMCAVGRCLTHEGAKLFVRKHVASIKYEGYGLLKQNLKPEYPSHTIDFWSDLQGFHDAELNWNETGMSDQGRLVRDKLAWKYLGQ